MFNFYKLIIKLDRWGRWVLLVLVILFIITGYGMTKQIMDPVLATHWHVNLLPIPFFIFLALHLMLYLKRIINFFRR